MSSLLASEASSFLHEVFLFLHRHGVYIHSIRVSFPLGGMEEGAEVVPIDRSLFSSESFHDPVPSPYGVVLDRHFRPEFKLGWFSDVKS